MKSEGGAFRQGEQPVQMPWGRREKWVLVPWVFPIVYKILPLANSTPLHTGKGILGNVVPANQVDTVGTYWLCGLDWAVSLTFLTLSFPLDAKQVTITPTAEL